MLPNTKICSKCKEAQAFEFFNKHKNSIAGLSSWCKKCYKKYRVANKSKMLEYTANWRQNNPEKYNQQIKRYYNKNKTRVLAKTKSYRQSNPDKTFNAYLKRRFGIDLAAYNKLLVSQNGTCALCSATASSLDGRKLAVDHCHATNKIRGLLCGKHNKALGLFKDNIEALTKAIDYLKINK